MPKEKEQKTRLPLMRTVHGTPKRAGHLAVGKGWSGGVFTRPLGRKDPPGPASGTVQSSEAAPGHFHSQPPAHRQVLALPGAPAGLCAAGAAPARVRMAGGTAAGAGRAAAVRRGRGRHPAPVPAVGRGARRPRGRSRLPRQRAGDPRWGSEGHRRLPHLPRRKKGTPSEGRAPEHRSPHTPASDSWQPSHPAPKKFRDAESDLKESFPWPLTPSPPTPG